MRREVSARPEEPPNPLLHLAQSSSVLLLPFLVLFCATHPKPSIKYRVRIGKPRQQIGHSRQGSVSILRVACLFTTALQPRCLLLVCPALRSINLLTPF